MAQTAQEYVAELYQKELGRSGQGDAGAQAWADLIQSGKLSREDVAKNIAASNEAQILRTYQQELGRSSVGDTGAAQWAAMMEAGQLSPEQLRQNVARSQEGAAYDVNRIYQSELKRAADDPGAQVWRDMLMRGEINEQQFIEAVRGSDEYRALTRPLDTPTTKPTPLNPAANTNPSMVRYQNQLQALQNQAIASADRGYFEPVYPIPQTPSYSAPAQLTQAPVQTAQAITPAPAVSVPMTYLSPAPPQYRNIDPFQSPFSTSFQSYFDIANARPQMSYPSPFVAQPSQQPTPGQAQTMSPYPFPFQYYQGMYSSPQAQTSLPAPAGPTTPTT